MRDTQLNLKMTKEEKEIIGEKAKRVNLSVSDFIRFLCLNTEIELVTKVKINDAKS